jgi:hypothetical protein
MSSANDWETRALERHCSHCNRESPGKPYAGKEYLRMLLGMKGDEGAWLAHKVEAFFWSDADMIHVHLCDDCASRLAPGEASEVPPPSATSPA